MDITTRNFFRLLRAGAFGKQEQVEPMSACKWRKTMQLALVHHVETEAYQGVEVLGDQFFVQIIPDDLREEWASKAYSVRRNKSSLSPVVNNHLQKKISKLAEKADPDSPDYAIMEQIIYLTNALLTDGEWVRRLLMLGELLREHGGRLNGEQIKKMIRQFRMVSMARLQCALLIELMGLRLEEIPFGVEPSAINVKPFASAIPHGQEQMTFSQGKDIFVHTSNASAVLWNARRSARFFRFDPLGSVSNLLSSFTSSLTNIEE